MTPWLTELPGRGGAESCHGPGSLALPSCLFASSACIAAMCSAFKSLTRLRESCPRRALWSFAAASSRAAASFLASLPRVAACILTAERRRCFAALPCARRPECPNVFNAKQLVGLALKGQQKG